MGRKERGRGGGGGHVNDDSRPTEHLVHIILYGYFSNLAFVA